MFTGAATPTLVGLACLAAAASALQDCPNCWEQCFKPDATGFTEQYRELFLMIHRSGVPYTVDQSLQSVAKCMASCLVHCELP